MYYNKAMKNIISKNKIIAAALAAVIMLSSMAACGKAATTVVQRKVQSNRGTTIHSVK